MWQMLKKTVAEFQKDECPRMAAALAFYTVFSLPAIVIAVVTLVGMLVNATGRNDGQEAAKERLIAYIAESSSPEVAAQIRISGYEPVWKDWDEAFCEA